jgi:hypothetical protein
MCPRAASGKARAVLVSVAAAAAALGTAAVAHAQTAERDIPVCRDETRDLLTPWSEQRARQVGVHVSEPHVNLLPQAAAGDACVESVDFSERQDGRAFDGIHDWVMASGCKHVLCGTPESPESNTFLAAFSGEFDLNTNVVPDVSSHLDDVLQRRKCFPDPWKAVEMDAEKHERSAGPPPAVAPTRDERQLCFPRTDTVHAEITPPGPLRRYLTSLWRPRTGDWLAWTRMLAEDKACMYGPFVADTGHAAKAEIHPIQMLWWNENVGRDPTDFFAPDGPYMLFLVQDASSRYVKTQDFVLEHPIPEGGTWRPWAKAPLPGIFEIPFWVGTNQPVQFRVEPIAGTEVTVHRPVPPATVVEGDAVRMIATLENSAKGIDAQMEVVCRGDDLARPGYLGKLILTAAVGHDREWEEGYAAVRVTDSRQPPSFRLPTAGGPSPCDTSERLRAIVTWKPTRTTKPARKKPYVAVREIHRGDHETVQKATAAMFAQAGWPLSPATPHPWPVLLRMETLEVEAKPSVACLEEAEEKKLKARATWEPRGQACDVVDGKTCGEVEVREVSASRARVGLDQGAWTDDTSVRKATLDFTVSVRPPHDLTRKFHSTVWSHSFQARHDEWMNAAARLCQELPGVLDAQPDVCPQGVAESARPGWLPGSQEVGVLVTNLTSDEVMTMTELSTLVKETCRLCGRASPSKVQAPVRIK